MTAIGAVLPDGVNLHDCPCASAEILDQLQKGERLLILETLRTPKGWLAVKVSGTGQSGYVTAACVEEVMPRLVDPLPLPKRKPKRDRAGVEALALGIAVIVAVLCALYLRFI